MLNFISIYMAFKATLSVCLKLKNKTLWCQWYWKSVQTFGYIFIFSRILQNPLLLSDSRLHLFVQTQLSPEEIEACVSGQTKYSVAEAIHEFACLKRRFPVEDEERKKEENHVDSDSERLLPYILLKMHTWS